MPGWISVIIKFMLPYLVSLAVNVGLPELAKFILRKLPWISKDTLDKIIQIVVDAINSIQVVKYDETLTKDAKKAQIRAIKRQARRDCAGPGCEIETKAL